MAVFPKLPILNRDRFHMRKDLQGESRFDLIGA